MSLNRNITDSGPRSRKLWYAVGTSLGILVAGVLAAWWPMFRPGLETVTGGLLGALALYCGANVGNKVAINKAVKTVSVVNENEDPEKGSK